MEVQFEYESADFIDAAHASQSRFLVAPRQRWASNLIIATFVGVSCLVYSVGKNMFDPPGLPDGRSSPLFSELLLPISPWLFILTWIIVVSWLKRERPFEKRNSKLGTAVQPASKPRKRNNPLAIYSIWLVATLTVFINGQYGYGTGPNRNSHTNDGVWAVPCICWSVYLIYIILINRYQIARSEKSAWASHEDRHRPLRMDFTAAGVVMTDLYSRSEFQWPYFLDVQETPRSFLLYISTIRYRIIPKRAFASPEMLNAFRNMVTTLAGKQPSAFPVLPVAAVGIEGQKPADSQAGEIS